MLPVRRLSPLATAAIAAAVLGSTLAPATQAAPASCAPGAITTTADASGAHERICNARHAQVEVVQGGGAPIASGRTSRTGRCAVPASARTARPGRSLITIVTTVDAAGRALQRTSTAYLCGSDAQWHQIAAPLAAVTLIPTSIVVERTVQA